MATYIKICHFALIMAFMIISSVVASPSRNKDIVVAIEEMERANYFTFVMLINMVPPDVFRGNITFLMPSDRSLSRTMISQDSVVDLLLRHSIPSPLLFDHLLHLPTNTMIPTSYPDLNLKVSNGGRKGLFLGNVRVVSPNICTRGYSMRCHGIDGLVSIPEHSNSGLASPVTCPTILPPIPASAPLLAPPSMAPTSALHGPAYETSGGSHVVSRGRPLMELALTCITFVWVLYTKSVSLI